MRALATIVMATMLSIASTAHAASDSVEFFRAVAIDNVDGARRLLQGHKVDPKALDERGDTALIAAIRFDATRIAGMLIADNTTDLEATNAAGETALMIAAYRNRKDMVDQLIARDAEVNRPGWTALHYAASVGARDIVADLLEHSAYIDAESPNKTTPLMMAARGGFVELCHDLIDAGADPTPVNERDLSASDFAKRAGDPILSAWLVDQAGAWRKKYGTASAPRPATKN